MTRIIAKDHKPSATAENGASHRSSSFDLAFVIGFLLVLASVGVIDLVFKGPSQIDSSPAWHQITAPLQGPFLQKLDHMSERLQDFEASIKRESLTRTVARDKVQQFLTHRFMLGSEQVTITKRGLLFRDDWQWVTGKSFLNTGSSWLAETRMAQSGAIIEFPDPRPAIFRFLEDCGKAPLILAPLPNKAMMMADSGQEPFNNGDFKPFVDEMRRRGLIVFWPFEKVPSLQGELFLQSDTHWTPEFMAFYAQHLAEFLQHSGHVTQGQQNYRLGPNRQIQHQGDLARMLHLNRHQTTFGSESVIIRPVIDASGAPWQSDSLAEILILGDSYVNIYTDPTMGWGEHAGLGPRLSLYLNKSLDVIARNGSAPTQTRAVLARRTNPLAGKRAIVWLFAIRDLAFGNWRPIPMPAAGTATQASSGVKDKNSGQVKLRAKLITQPSRCDPEDTPYRNALINLKFEVVEVLEGSCEDRLILATFQLMTNRQITSVAQCQPGTIYELTLAPTQPSHTKNWTLIDDTEAYDLDPRWVSDFH